MHDLELYRKGRRHEARLCYLGHVLMENRHGLVVDTKISLATGTAERDCAWDFMRGERSDDTASWLRA